MDTTTYYSINAIVSPVNSGSISGLSISNKYKSNNKIVLTAIPEQDYIFGYWSGDLSGEDTSDMESISILIMML